MLCRSHSSALSRVAVLLIDGTASLPDCTNCLQMDTHIYSITSISPSPTLRLNGVQSVHGKAISLVFLWTRYKKNPSNDILILTSGMLPSVFPLLWQTVRLPPHLSFIFPLDPATSCSASGEHMFPRVIFLKAVLQAALNPTELLSSSGGQPGVEEWANANNTGGVSES